MNRHFIAFAFMVILLVGCSPDEPTITSFVDEWRILIAGPLGVSTISMPKGEVANSNVWSGPSGTSFPIEETKQFRDNIYLLHASQPWIVILDASSLVAKDTIDLGSKGIAIDITFANATTAYVSLPMSRSVGVVDLTVNSLVAIIDLNAETSGIASTGNQICVALLSTNEVAIIDSRTNLVEARLSVDPAPTFVEADDLNAVFCIVSLGNGKINSETQTPPSIAFVSATTRAILKKLEISGRPTNAAAQLPRGLVVTAGEFAFVPVQNGLTRVNTRTRNKVSLVQFDSYDRIGYNPARAEILLQRTSGGSTNYDVVDEFGEVVKTTTTQPDSAAALLGIGR
ncbi:MAG: hypothetical protein NTX15_02560 [Candidatus Kapabacteria bacterium]|nr:hypothetical protein [Candidatus Kapabacteria bacterium]